jgi:tetratricopeptide (TPR) repeat protein
MNIIEATIRRELVLLVIVGLISVSSCSWHSDEGTGADTTETAAQDVSQADQLYGQRENLVRLRQAILLLRQAVTIDPGNYDALWRLSKFNYYLATHTSDSDERDKAFDDGIQAGKTAVELQSGKPDGHFWLGAIYGAAAQRSAIAGLATVDDIRNEMETVLRIDEGYQNGSAYMVLGLVYLDEPGFAGGDPRKAVALMEKGLRFGEGNAFLHLHLAEAYLKVGRPTDARRQLNAIISMKPDQDYLPEYNEAVGEARKLLEKPGTVMTLGLGPQVSSPAAFPTHN